MVTLGNPEIVKKTVAAIRFLYPSLPILARARDLPHSESLKKAGATETILEFVEGSLILGRAMLLNADVGVDKVEDLVNNFRQDDYALPIRLMAGTAQSEPSGAK